MIDHGQCGFKVLVKTLEHDQNWVLVQKNVEAGTDCKGTDCKGTDGKGKACIARLFKYKQVGHNNVHL